MDTLFTFSEGRGQEMMIYALNILNYLSEKLANSLDSVGNTAPITIVVNENNKDIVPYFLRAARLSKIPVDIQKSVCESLHPDFLPRTY